MDNPGKDERIPVSVTVELPNLKCECTKRMPIYQFSFIYISTFLASNQEMKPTTCFFLSIVVGLDIQDDMGRHEVGFVDNTAKTPIGDNQQGCIFHSTFFINKVPGNFHVSTHSSHKQPDDPDFSHVIKEIKLGDQIIADVPGSFNPLAGVSKNTELGIFNFLRLYPCRLCFISFAVNVPPLLTIHP